MRQKLGEQGAFVFGFKGKRIFSEKLSRGSKKGLKVMMVPPGKQKYSSVPVRGLPCPVPARGVGETGGFSLPNLRSSTCCSRAPTLREGVQGSRFSGISVQLKIK